MVKVVVRIVVLIGSAERVKVRITLTYPKVSILGLRFLEIAYHRTTAYLPVITMLQEYKCKFILPHLTCLMF